MLWVGEWMGGERLAHQRVLTLIRASAVQASFASAAVAGHKVVRARALARDPPQRSPGHHPTQARCAGTRCTWSTRRRRKRRANTAVLRFHREDGSHVQVSAVDAEGLLPLSTSISAQYKPSISCRHTRVKWLLVDAGNIILYHLQRDSESLLHPLCY